MLRVNSPHTRLLSVLIISSANKIQPGIVRKIDQKHIKMLERGNIQNFLIACEKLGVLKVDLFDVSDLYEDTNLTMVYVFILLPSLFFIFFFFTPLFIYSLSS